MAGKNLEGEIGKNLPSCILDDKKRALPQILKDNGGHITRACKQADVARSTFYEWYHSDPEFRAIIDDPEFKRECRRMQAEYYSSMLMSHAKENNTAAIYFFNKSDDIMKLLHMSPTRMDIEIPSINTLEEIDNALNYVLKACTEGRINEKELAQLRDILALKREVVKDRELGEQVKEMKLQLEQMKVS